MLNTKVNYPKITLAAARVNAGYSQKEAASRLKSMKELFKTTKVVLMFLTGIWFIKSVNFTISRLILFFLALNYA